MGYAKLKRLSSYVERVCRDAVQDVGSRNRVQWQYTIVLDKYLLFSLKTRNKKVYNKIIYRLSQNVYENFGYEFYNVRRETSLFEVYDGVDINYSICAWDNYGKPSTIRYTGYLNGLENNQIFTPISNEQIAMHYRALLNTESRISGKCTDKLREYKTWEEYSDVYKKTYGSIPMSITSEIFRGLISEVS